MSLEIVQAARKERERLLAELHATPAWKRLCKVEELLKEYGPAVDVPPPATDKPVKRTAVQIEETKREKVDRLSTECVRMYAPNVQGHKIHDYLKSNGVEVTAASLSAYLSKNKAIAYDLKGKGWNLRNDETPQQKESSEDNKTAARSPTPAAVNGASRHQHDLSLTS